MDKFLSIRDAASRLGIHRRTLQAMILRGDVDFERVTDRLFLIRTDQLAAIRRKIKPVGRPKKQKS